MYWKQQYQPCFYPNRKYYISNARLIRTNPRFIVGSYERTWSLTKQTLVELDTDEALTPLPCKFDFTPFNQMGHVVMCFPTQQNESRTTIIKRDVIIVNEEYVLIT
ncbi:hypothetical protein LXL04_015367 [Taraxacum kok-saghyz]